jgi:hypothetical protein
MSIAGGPNLLSQIQTCNEEDFVVLRLLSDGTTPIDNYIQAKKWNLVYQESERNIHIYQAPDFLEK